MKLKGKIWKFGDNVNTDEIIPARYLNTTDSRELAKHCMEGIDPNFVKKITPSDMIVAGDNFGCGSSREHAPIAIKAAGISCVIAKSFARIFFRNAINIGLPILESSEFYSNSNENDEIEINLDKGEIKNLSNNKTFRCQPFPEFMQKIISAGGLLSKFHS